MEVVLNMTDCNLRANRPGDGISRLVADYYGAELLCRSNYGDFDFNRRIDRLYFTNGLAGYCDWREVWQFCLLPQVREFVYLCNDYTMEVPTQVRNWLRRSGIRKELWSLYDPRMEAYKTKSQSLDWDEVHQVPWSNLSWKPLPFCEPEGTLIYWGARRTGKERYFQRYIDGNSSFRVSCTRKSSLKWVGETDTIPVFEKMPDDLQGWKATIYFEDESPHPLGRSNRFFEAASAGLALFVDAEQEPEFPVDPLWFVEDREELESKTKLHWRRVREEQREAWSGPYIQELKEALP